MHYSLLMFDITNHSLSVSLDSAIVFLFSVAKQIHQLSSFLYFKAYNSVNMVVLLRYHLVQCALAILCFWYDHANTDALNWSEIKEDNLEMKVCRTILKSIQLILYASNIVFLDATNRKFNRWISCNSTKICLNIMHYFWKGSLACIFPSMLR